MSTIVAHTGSFVFGFLAANARLGYYDLVAAAVLAIVLWMLYERRLFETMRQETWGPHSKWNLKAVSAIGVIFTAHTALAFILMSLSYWPARMALAAAA